MAKLAADRGVRIQPACMGTKRRRDDRLELEHARCAMTKNQEVSLLTRGEYSSPAPPKTLKKVYDGLSSKLVVEKRETEITAMSLRWARRWRVLARPDCGGSAA